MIPRPREAALRRSPYRLFFPLGLLLAIAGVGHWLLHAIGLLDDYRPVFHAMTQVQGFLLSFAVGFLLTMLPRRTKTDPPALATIGVLAVGLVGTVTAAAFGAWALSQVFFLTVMGTLLGFAVTRLSRRRAGRRPPVGFVWIPIAFGFGIGGSVLTGLAGFLGMDRHIALHDLGRGLVLQGMFTAMILGVGGLALPLMTRGEAPADDSGTIHDRARRAAHLVAAALLLGTFVFESQLGLAAAYLGRACIAATVLIWSAELHRPPSLPGANRWAIWCAAWAIPIGYAAAGIFVQDHKAALHVLFIGGFALLTLAVSTQVTLGHGDFPELMNGRPAAVVWIASALFVAIAPRLLMAWDPGRFFVWMAVAAGAFLVAAATWAGFVVPKLR